MKEKGKKRWREEEKERRRVAWGLVGGWTGQGEVGGSQGQRGLWHPGQFKNLVSVGNSSFPSTIFSLSLNIWP